MDIDPERAKTYSRYRHALATARDLKPTVRELAIEDLRAGVTAAQLADATGETREVFRRIARDLDLPVDPRYTERAAASRKRRGPDAAEAVPPLAAHQARLIAGLTDEQASQLATRAYTAADRRQYAELNEASTDGDRAVIKAGLAIGMLKELDLLTV